MCRWIFRAIRKVTYEIFLEKIHPEDREFVHRKWQAALRGEPYDIEHCLLLADQIKWVREKAKMHFDGEGRPLFAIGFTQDITTRKLIEATLPESEERNRQIIHSSIDGFMRVDTQARLIEVNDAYCRMSGYSREELLTKVVPDLEALESTDEVAARIRRIGENGSDRFTTSHRRKDGRIFEVYTNL
jgi:PAS domain S-box-containing protein